MPLYPVDLPCGPVDRSLETSIVDNVLRGPSDIEGTESRRKRYSARYINYSFSLSLTRAQKERLELFFFSECSSGALSFTMRDPANAGNTNTFKWHGAPSFREQTAGGARWAATLSVLRVD